jgi:hypothetical protein
VLSTQDIDACVSYYVGMLGFAALGYNYNSKREKAVVYLERDSALIQFRREISGGILLPLRKRVDAIINEGMELITPDLFVATDSVQDLFTEFASRGVDIVQRPQQTNLMELIIEDCNSYYISFHE